MFKLCFYERKRKFIQRMFFGAHEAKYFRCQRIGEHLWWPAIGAEFGVGLGCQLKTGIGRAEQNNKAPYLLKMEWRKPA